MQLHATSKLQVTHFSKQACLTVVPMVWLFPSRLCSAVDQEVETVDTIVEQLGHSSPDKTVHQRSFLCHAACFRSPTHHDHKRGLHLSTPRRHALQMTTPIMIIMPHPHFNKHTSTQSYDVKIRCCICVETEQWSKHKHNKQQLTVIQQTTYQRSNKMKHLA